MKMDAIFNFGSEIISILNDGKEIIKTDYFKTRRAKEHILGFSINAGYIQVLIPFRKEDDINAMNAAKEVVLSRGPYPEMKRKEFFHIMFDDHTQYPYNLFSGKEQWISGFPDKRQTRKKWGINVWVPDKKQIEKPVKVFESRLYYRLVKKIPCFDPVTTS